MFGRLAPLALLLCVTQPTGTKAEPPAPISAAHAHNDYWHRRPLVDALSHGFCSVEADVFLVDGKLLVGHHVSELRDDRTLDALYLEPLQERVRNNGGRVYRDGPPFTLFVDVKSDAEATYAAIDEALSRHKSMLTTVRNGERTQKAIDVIISGNRAAEAMAKQPVRYAGIDGRLSDLQSRAPSHLMPILSDNWRNIFRWQGDGPMPDAQREKLHRIVSQAHATQRRVRFWATPDSPAVWQELRNAKVDLINTDDLAALSEFLRNP